MTKGITLENNTFEENAVFLLDATETGFRRRQPWTIRLTSDSAVFSASESEEIVEIPKNQAHACIRFHMTMLSPLNLTLRKEGVKYKFKLSWNDLKSLGSWLPEGVVPDMRRELRLWGIWLVALGAIHVAWQSPFWGSILVALGILSFLIRRREMFFVIGSFFLLASVLNAVLSVSASVDWSAWFWRAFSILQLFWGIQIIRKSRLYALTK